MLRRTTVALAIALFAAPAAAAPRVATDIGPVQSIVARVMGDLGAPDPILPPGASPHDHALRPSEARALSRADVVVWVGPVLTPWLEEPLAALAPEARVVSLAEAPGVEALPVRQGGHDHGHDGGHAHEHGAIDGHLWLDPRNAAAGARAVAVALGAEDPENAAAYAANAEAFAREMTALEAEIDQRLAPVRGRPFIVFHDAYQYFERRFDMPAAGSVAIQDGAPPGTARVAAIRDKVREAGVVCAFTEPQFRPRLLATVLEGTAVRTGVLDPLGTDLPPGPELYPALMMALADSLADCLDG
jgi:zinc transport system substrate-binding protein